MTTPKIPHVEEQLLEKMEAIRMACLTKIYSEHSPVLEDRPAIQRWMTETQHTATSSQSFQAGVNYALRQVQKILQGEASDFG